jgi:uncharacterized membrane protein YuzA (DUF378 family)
MKVLDIITAVLLFIGGINWGLMGFFDFNLISAVFGEATALTKVIYAVVGLSGLYEAFSYTFGFRAAQHRWCETVAAVKH